jgi:hypothetical protein
MIIKTRKIRLAAVFLVAASLIQPVASFAQQRDRHDEHKYYRYQDHPHFGLHVSLIPDGFITVVAGGAQYYYYDGLYYNRLGREYVLVTPPIGAVVRSIPPDYRAIVINGVTYYSDNGMYYVYTPYGYQVVPAPVTVVQAPPLLPVVAQPVQIQAVSPAIPHAMPQAATQVAPQAPERETVTINVPNSDGSFIPITLLKSNNGYTGPQGEYYEGHPTVAQLKALYGK